MMKSLKTALSSLIVLALFAVCLPMQVLAAGADVQRTVRVGWYTIAGMQSGTSPEDMGGYNYEYLCKIAQYENWNLEFVYGSWPELERKLIDGGIDILGDVAKTDARMAKYDYSTYPSGSSHMLMICRADDDRYTYDDYSALDGAVVGDASSEFRRGLLNREAAAHGISVTYREYVNDSGMLAALDSGETDVAILSNVSTYQGYKVIEEWESNPFYFVVSKSSPGILSELNDAMKRIQNSDQNIQERLFEKYFGENSTGTTIALTREEKQYLAQSETVTVAVSRNEKPLSYEKDGRIVGLIPDYLDLLSEKTGLKFEYVICDQFSELAGTFASGNAMIFSQFPNNYEIAEKSNAYLTVPFYTLLYGMVSWPSTSKVRTVAIEKGKIFLQQKLEEEGYAAVIFSSEADCLNAVARHAVDAAAISSLSYEQLSYHARYAGLSFHSNSNLNIDMCLAISKTQGSALFSIIEKGMGVISDSSLSEIVLSSSVLKPEYTMEDRIIMNSGQIFIILTLSLLVLMLLMWRARQKKMNQRLTAAKLEAEKANSAKSAFLSSMSHDLRTPLNGILGFADIDIRESTMEGKQNALEKVQLSGRLLLDLVNDTLELSRIESGKVTMEPKVIESAGIASPILESIQQLAREKGINFVAETDRFPKGKIYVDSLKLQKIVLNLLSNAVKYTPAGGTVRYSVEAIDPPVRNMTRRIIVEDNGIGMSSEFLAHLYEPFAQERRKETYGIQGTGLGLSIVKKLVDLMNGTIEVESSLGKGTRFTVELPLGCPEGVSEDAETEQISDTCSLAGKRILLCEDNELNAEIASALLKEKDMLVDCASNGQEGLDQFQGSEIGYYDAVLMDIRMPVMNGYDAARAIRASGRRDAKAIIIIAMTADAFEENEREARDAGMDDYITKPVDPGRLYKALSSHLR